MSDSFAGPPKPAEVWILRKNPRTLNIILPFYCKDQQQQCLDFSHAMFRGQRGQPPTLTGHPSVITELPRKVQTPETPAEMEIAFL